MKRSAAGAGKPGRGFTLVELLIVVAVIGLLMAIALPSMRVAKEHAMNALCQSNLHKLVPVLHSVSAERPGNFVLYTQWVNFVVERGARSLTQCPKDTPEETATTKTGALEFLYILQHSGKYMYSYVNEIIETGVSSADSQVKLNPAGVVGDHGWVPGGVGANQYLICIDDDAACRITMGDPILIESIDAPGDTSCGSDHWVCWGDGSNWEAEVLMRLTGNNYQNIVDPPVYLRAGGSPTSVSSYGMNNQVAARFPRPQQLLLIEYAKVFVDVDGTGRQDDDWWKDPKKDPFRARHFDRANYVRVDGVVQHGIKKDLLSSNPIWKDPANPPVMSNWGKL